jgi:hypothetical protein
MNAFKHGLAIPVSALPELSEEVLKIARALVEDAQEDPHLFDAAVRVAEAAVDVSRVRRARVELMSRPAREAHPLQTMLRGRVTQKRIRQWLFSELDRQQSEAPPAAFSFPSPLTPHAVRDIEAFKQAASHLEKLDRYERRSLSRRNRAMRAFDEIKAMVDKDAIASRST